jgi:branched-chain amino acid transport system substrate-binding protein
MGKKIVKVGMIYENTDMGQTCATAARKLLPEKGYKVVSDVSYPARASDLTTTIAKLKAGGPEVVLQASYIGDALLIAKTADRLGLNAPVIDNGNINDPSYIKNLGAVAEGKAGIAVWNKDIPGKGMELHKAYKARYGEEIYAIYVSGYQAIWLFKEAIEKAGSTDRTAIRDALANINIPLEKLYVPYERIHFNETGYNTGGNYIITQVQEGEWVTVWPEKLASKRYRCK